MKTEESKTKFNAFFHRVFRRAPEVRDPWLGISMHLFNYDGGWNRTFARAEYARSWAA